MRACWRATTASSSRRGPSRSVRPGRAGFGLMLFSSALAVVGRVGLGFALICERGGRWQEELHAPPPPFEHWLQLQRGRFPNRGIPAVRDAKGGGDGDVKGGGSGPPRDGSDRGEGKEEGKAAGRRAAEPPEPYVARLGDLVRCKWQGLSKWCGAPRPAAPRAEDCSAAADVCAQDDGGAVDNVWITAQVLRACGVRARRRGRRRQVRGRRL